MRDSRDLYCSIPMPVCYDSDEETPEGEGGEPRTFTQDEVNEFLAKDRRKHKGMLEQSEAAYKKLLENTELGDNERKALQEQLEVVQGELRTQKAQLATKDQLHAEEIKKHRAERDHWKQRYNTMVINQALVAAAVQHEAYSPDQIVTQLDRNTKLIPDPEQKGEFKVVVEFDDVDAEGKPIKTVRSPAETVARMKEMERYANFFKNNIVAGTGGSSNPGGLPTNGQGRIDLRKVAQDPELYRKLRKENPNLLFGS